MRAALALSLTGALFGLTGCSGATEGTTDAAIAPVRKEMPKEYKEKELPPDPDMHVFGRDKLETGGTQPTAPKSGK